MIIADSIVGITNDEATYIAEISHPNGKKAHLIGRKMAHFLIANNKVEPRISSSASQTAFMVLVYRIQQLQGFF